MASQVAVNHPPQGNCRFESCLWCNGRFAHAVAKWNGRSPPKAAFAGSNPAGGTECVCLVRYASGKRGGCLPPKASSILVRTAQYARVSQSAEDAGPDPVCCRCKSCPWYRRARSTTAVQPHDKRQTRGPTPPAPTTAPGSSGEARWL